MTAMTGTNEIIAVCLDCGRVFKATPEMINYLGWKEVKDKDGVFYICGPCRADRTVDGIDHDQRRR